MMKHMSVHRYPGGWTGNKIMCAACGFKMRNGQIVIRIGTKVAHRRCLTIFVDWSYDRLPLDETEIEGDHLYPETAEERLAGKERRDRAAFEAYRAELADRYGVSLGETESVFLQVETATAADVEGDNP